MNLYEKIPELTQLFTKIDPDAKKLELKKI